MAKGRKEWYTIRAMKEFNNQVLGETMAYEDKELIGRSVKANLMHILNDPRKQSIKVYFKIDKVESKVANANFKKYELIPSHVKRMVKKMKSKIDDSFIVETKNKIKVKVKPLIIPSGKINRSLQKEIRKNVKNFFIENAKKNDLSAFISLVVDDKITGTLRRELKKLYPISSCRLRVVEIVS